MVPYTLGSSLKKRMQSAEDHFNKLVGEKRVRVVEAGGDRIIHLLGRNDPWSSEHSCGDKSCIPCGSRAWLKEQKSQAKRSGETLPKGLLDKSAPQCRRKAVSTHYSVLTASTWG